jgi:ATP-binding cassette, subfamily B, bacterial
MATPTATPKNQSLWRLLGLLKPKQGQYIAGLVLRVALTTTERMFIAYIVVLFVNAMTSLDMNLFLSTLVIWASFYVAWVGVAPFIFYLWRSAIFQGTANIREAVFKHLQRLPVGYHELHHSGDALSTLTNDVAAAEQAYQQDLLTLVEASVQGVAAGIFMLLLEWRLALLVILGGLAPLAINTLFARPLRKVGQDIQANLGTMSERMTDLLAGFNVVRTFNLGDWIIARFSQANDRVLESSLHRIRLEAALAGANDFGGMFSLISYIVAALMVLNGQTTFGVLIGMIQLSNQIYYLVYALGGAISKVQSALAASDRIFALLDSTPEPEQYDGKTQALPLPPPAMGPNESALIEFKDVTFGYEPDQDIIKSLAFAVQKGQVAAFAGPSGGGKSTIFKLLLGCYPVSQGAILANGQPVNAVKLTDLRELFAYVPQDAYLFAGSIMENIGYGKPDSTLEEVIASAKAAFAHDFIKEFPEGYQTLVGERGAHLSGGQRQRIAIARALLKDAPILLLDEATSALDSESEQLVQQALKALMKGRTTLVIAHRLSTIVNADIIYVIDGGHVVEQGRHTDLLAKSGVYANLYDLQYKLEAQETTAADPSQ